MAHKDRVIKIKSNSGGMGAIKVGKKKKKLIEDVDRADVIASAKKLEKKMKEPLSPSKRRALRIQKEDIASGETAAAKAFMTRNLPYTGDIHGKKFNKGGRTGLKHGKFVKVATPHADISKYVEKDSSKSPKHYRKEGSTLEMGKKRAGRRAGQATRDPGKKFKVKIPAIELIKEGPRNEKFGLRIKRSLGGAATHGFNSKILRTE
tara:strand:- start:243 stop:860 length:618 start_codon:yes stop_codon:yes gene_type:complete